MTPERWEQVRQLFDTAVEVDPAKRSAFLDAECGADAELRAEVERLLAAEDASGGFFGGATNVKGFLGAEPERPVFSEHDIVADRFLIVRYIGRGGMGEVYEAEDLELHDQVALKTLLPRYSADQRHVSRFRREVHVARKVKHPNVCKIHDVGRHREGSVDITFLTMELLDGETLSDYLKREGKLKPAESATVIEQMAAGLQALHEGGVVHRDFKPGNIILVPSGAAAPRPVVTDFGLAVLANEEARGEQTEVTEPGHILGTPDYMAPEHMAGQNVGPWSDIYSFGLVVCKSLTGHHPFRREQGEEESDDPSGRVLSLLPDAAGEVIRRCLSAIPSERPTAPLDVAQAIFAAEDGAASEIVADSSEKRGRRRFLTKKRVLVGVPAIALSLLLLGIRLQERGLSLGGIVGSLQDDLCSRFPGTAMFCVLPSDRDVAFLPLTVEADTEDGLTYGNGLSQFIGDSLYRLRSNKGEFCFHVRDDKPHVGVPLIFSGEMQVLAGVVRIDTTLVRTSDGQVLRKETFERGTEDLDALHQGLIRKFAELLGYDLEPEQLASWLAEGPRDATAFENYLTGLGLLREREYEQAAEQFETALGGEQGGLAFAAAARGLGDAKRHLFAQSKDVRWAREAEQAYRQALAIPSADLHRSWGMLEQTQGNYENAVERFEQALEADRFDYVSQREIARSHNALGNRARADEVLSNSAEQQPGCWLIRNFRAKTQLDHGQIRDSEQSLLEVVHLAPRNPLGYNNLAFLYLSEGRYDDVIEWAAKSTQINDSSTGRMTLGVGYMHRGCIDEALVNFRHAVRQNPKHFLPWYRLAEALQRASAPGAQTLNALRQTADLTAEALVERPGDEDALCASARSLALLGRGPEALAELTQLKQAAPSADRTPLCAAAVYESLGDRNKAFGSLRAGLERGATVFSVDQTPLSKAFRADPRYFELLAEFGAEQVQASWPEDTPAASGCPQGRTENLTPS
jgi:serine/threonine protein kinase/tetratricopeptide (TPR) repeat protein